MIKRILFILKLLLLPIVLFSQQDYLRKIPTSYLINYYVQINGDSIIKEYEDFFNVKVYDIYFETDNLEDYTGNEDGSLLGRYYTDYIIITNEEKYIGYSLKTTPKIRVFFSEKLYFVKGVMIHELSHHYIKQIMKRDSLFSRINRNYKYNKTFGSTLIEEGICEYCSNKMGEIKVGSYEPTTMNDLLDKNNEYKIWYEYGPNLVKRFLDENGLEKGIIILLTNPPPSNDEILDLNRYFNRIVK